MEATHITQLNRRITEAQEEAYVAQQEAEEALETLHRLQGERINVLRRTAYDIGIDRLQLLTFHDGHQLIGTWGYESHGKRHYVLGFSAGFFTPYSPEAKLTRVELADLHFVERYETQEGPRLLPRGACVSCSTETTNIVLGTENHASGPLYACAFHGGQENPNVNS